MKDYFKNILLVKYFLISPYHFTCNHEVWESRYILPILSLIMTYLNPDPLIMKYWNLEG